MGTVQGEDDKLLSTSGFNGQFQMQAIRSGPKDVKL